MRLSTFSYLAFSVAGSHGNCVILGPTLVVSFKCTTLEIKSGVNLMHRFFIFLFKNLSRMQNKWKVLKRIRMENIATL